MKMEEGRVLEANAAFYDAFAEGDYDRMGDLWARHAHVTCIHPGWDVLSGRTGVLASWRAILGGEPTPIEGSAAS
jgi:hypothetical protein